MSKSIQSAAALALLGFGLIVTASSQAMAYSCMAQFKRANELIKQAERLVTKDTDSRILAVIAQAKGVAQAGLISHKAASERHTGKTGKYVHSDSVRMGKSAQALAKQAIFLLSGEVR